MKIKKLKINEFVLDNLEDLNPVIILDSNPNRRDLWLRITDFLINPYSSALDGFMKKKYYASSTEITVISVGEIQELFFRPAQIGKENYKKTFNGKIEFNNAVAKLETIFIPAKRGFTKDGVYVNYSLENNLHNKNLERVEKEFNSLYSFRENQIKLKEFDLMMLSLEEESVLTLLFAAARANKNNILLIEEPGLHLSSELQRQIIHSIRKVNNFQSQILLTTNLILVAADFKKSVFML